ncbi:MAG TPA: hypothetical protein VK741_25650 [Acetobacteraceae bacterium]|jgi:hypothetical protein|nr:hypothetical protein [Acetobacteraceae bacterium]
MSGITTQGGGAAASWAHQGGHALNRAAHWILAEALLAGTAWSSLKASDPMLAKGMNIVIAEGVARGLPEAEILATEHDLLATVAAVAAATDTAPVPLGTTDPGAPVVASNVPAASLGGAASVPAAASATGGAHTVTGATSGTDSLAAGAGGAHTVSGTGDSLAGGDHASIGGVAHD